MVPAHFWLCLPVTVGRAMQVFGSLSTDGKIVIAAREETCSSLFLLPFPGKRVLHYLFPPESVCDERVGAVGVGEVIKGWDRGVEGMRVGDKRRLTVPASMAYGSQGAG